jgi:dTMP kinase
MGIGLDRGRLIAFEGIDGAGKTTQVGLLFDRLSRLGFDVVRTKEPTGGSFGQRLRRSATEGRLPPEQELEMFISDRREHVATLIGPALAQREVVLVDRYYFSTAAYQGARGLDPEAILARNEEFAPPPDLLVLLVISPRTAIDRISARGDNAGNLFEQQGELERCAEMFSRLQRPYVLRLDGEQPPETIHDQIVRALDAGAVLEMVRAAGS